MKKLVLLAAIVPACSWGQFDDLSDSTPARAEEKPDGVKASDYGIGVVGATVPSNTSGGTIAVLSAGPGNFSTLELDPGGKDQNLGDSESLLPHTIDSLSNAATLLFDGVGSIALVDNSNSGTIIAVTGNTSGLTVDTQVGTPAHPTATAFANGELVVAVDSTMTVPSNVFSVKGTAVVNCTLNDNAGMPLVAAALAIDGTKLWAYAKSGAFFGYDLAALDMPSTCINLAPTSAVAMAGPAMNGGHIDVIPGKFAIVTAFDTNVTTTGQVQVVATSPAVAVVGTPMAAPGVHSAAFANLPDKGMVVLGYPNRADTTTTGAGAVDLHTIAVDTGVLDGLPAQTLTIPGAETNHLFGRSVATTNYNGKPIVVASASNTVYSYYATALYEKR
ncbi:MAG TPA: hypothetical protein VFQ65_24340 [Kofleriaceae bacterium]|nr:hypothetical protein [Kofleriaceae bacterium]